jgi:hypothetical protein
VADKADYQSDLLCPQSAVACNSLFRGLFAFIMSEIALPIRNGIGDGGLYTLFAGLLACSSCTFVFLAFKGTALRQRSTRAT